MINLEEEARKRRERLRSSLNDKKQSETGENESVAAPSTKLPEIKRKAPKNEEEFQVPEGEILLDSSGAEILSLDSK